MSMWPFTKGNSFKSNTKRTSIVNPAVFKRSYVAAKSGRLYNWQSASDRSADGDVKNALVALRRRSRELVQNEPLAKRYLSLLNTQVIGRLRTGRAFQRGHDEDHSLDRCQHQVYGYPDNDYREERVMTNVVQSVNRLASV
ncbi:uncharacterized protein METZ01_LOCUS293877 [marine metagenome]|uniref:Uncharacterized protein n=1 Tax=marine metagenome TaxID=408172 RepID=A0A382LWY0_9ZZZZ